MENLLVLVGCFDLWCIAGSHCFGALNANGWIGILQATGSPAEAAFDEGMKAVSEKGGEVFFRDLLGHTSGAATRASAISNLTGGWDAFVNRMKIDIFGMKPNDNQK